jgi:hypothetical protein
MFKTLILIFCSALVVESLSDCDKCSYPMSICLGYHCQDDLQCTNCISAYDSGCNPCTNSIYDPKNRILIGGKETIACERNDYKQQYVSDLICSLYCRVDEVEFGYCEQSDIQRISACQCYASPK